MPLMIFLGRKKLYCLCSQVCAGSIEDRRELHKVKCREVIPYQYGECRSANPAPAAIRIRSLSTMLLSTVRSLLLTSMLTLRFSSSVLMIMPARPRGRRAWASCASAWWPPSPCAWCAPARERGVGCVADGAVQEGPEGVGHRAVGRAVSAGHRFRGGLAPARWTKAAEWRRKRARTACSPCMAIFCFLRSMML